MLSGNKETEVKGAFTNRQSSDFDLSDTGFRKACTWLEFPAGVSWAPESLAVNGRKGRRIVCVLAQDRLHYRVYDLDGSPGNMAAQEARTEGSDEAMT